MRLEAKQGARSGGAEDGLHNALGVDLHQQPALIQSLHRV
jgi:hypothetical protein